MAQFFVTIATDGSMRAMESVPLEDFVETPDDVVTYIIRADDADMAIRRTVLQLHRNLTAAQMREDARR